MAEIMYPKQSSEPFPSDSTQAKAVKKKHKDQNKQIFPIVGIAASAGGLEAFTQLLENLPIDTGMAFVLIQHLEPAHKSLLTAILAKITQMPVQEAKEGMIIEPNHVYVIPPNATITIRKGALKIMPREQAAGRFLPGDAFLCSLAAEQGNKAIGVILSGSAKDGTLGIQEIKCAGGLTFAQSEATAQFADMPKNAIATGHVDFILSPSEIARELAKIASHPHINQPITAAKSTVISESDNPLTAVFTLLLANTGVDFSNYKQTTIRRRIHRRMVLHNINRLDDYIQYLQNNLAEVHALYQEVLISVTSFFRDPEVYQSLKEEVFPVITKDKSFDSPIRIWVPGCATGEEAYSIAISLIEYLDNLNFKPNIQIFATDINEKAIEKARLGIYKDSQMLDVSPERTRRFFNQVQEGYQINKLVRELCVFAKHNLIGDPPFSNLDLISCRNLLIYFQPVLQEQVMSLFHYSLKPTGFLILGLSEIAGKFSELFTLVDRKYKIYARKLVPTPLISSFTISNYPTASISLQKRKNEKIWDVADLQKEADQIVLNRYAPTGVLINDNMDILQFRGETSLYLKLPLGQPSFNLLKMARKGLLEELRTAIHQAKRQGVAARKENILIEGNTPPLQVNIEVIPFQIPVEENPYFLVLFENVPQLTNQFLTSIPVGAEIVGTDSQVLALQQELAITKHELAATQEYLQVISQEHETTTQELKVANEEILSSNEELQSTNEELQTAKEEVQATNEELNTTNQELHSRNRELNQVNNDILNLLNSVNIPIIILSSDLRIRRFTTTAQQILNLIPTDVDRPFSDIRSTINLPNLELLLLEVIDTLHAKELEVEDQQGHWYNLRIRPYRTRENQIDGVVIVLVDINDLKRSTQQLEQARNYAEAIVETVPDALLVLNSELRVITANLAFYQLFQVTPTQTEKQLIFALGNGQWQIPELQSLLAETLSQNIKFQDFEVQHSFEKIGHKTMRLNGRQILLPGNEKMVLLAIQDITQQKKLEIQRDESLAKEQSARLEAEASNRSKDEFLSILSHELRNPLNAMLGWSQLLRKQNLDPVTMNRAIEVIHRSAKAQTQLIEDLLDISRITTGKLRLHNQLLDLVPVIQAALEVVYLSATAKDIHILTRLQPNIGKVLGDADRLQQVIWNLLSNAIKFTPSGGQVEVSLESVNSQAEIRVSDNGEGIATDFLPYVFERFRQADSSRTRPYNGLGLGLSIVRYLVELHGGTIQADSLGEGQGTTMIVKLPLKSALDEPAFTSDLQSRDLSRELKSQVDDIPSLEGLHILVVDDEADIRELLLTILQEYGAQVTTATSANEALLLLTAQPEAYNILLSDIGMPGQDGYNLIRQVRELSPEAGGQIPAAALTGYVSHEEIQAAYLAGFQAHIAKPVEPFQLVFMMANLVK
jgi:two-component system CheB/CheR fusion protein